MAGLLAGITFLLWGLQLLAIITISNTLLGILALVTGILWILAGANIWSYNVPVRRAE